MIGFNPFRRIEVRYDTGLVGYTLTFEEACQVVVAGIKAEVTGKAPSTFMSSKLEELLCGFVPQRHTVLRTMTNEDIDALTPQALKALQKEYADSSLYPLH